MDDSIFQSKRSSIHLESPSTAKTEETKISSWKAILLESKSRLTVVQNKTMVTISLFNILALALILFTFFDVRWLLINENSSYTYWANLISVGKICPNADPLDGLCEEPAQVIYITDMISLFSSGCQMEGDLTEDDPANLCASLKILRIMGVFATIGIWMSMFLQLYCISRFLRQTSKKLKNLMAAPSLKKYLISTFILYFLSWIVWLVASYFAIPNNTSSSFFGRLGISLYMYLGAIVVFGLMGYWYQARLASSVKMNLVSALLDAENKYSKQVSLKFEL